MLLEDLLSVLLVDVLEPAIVAHYLGHSEELAQAVQVLLVLLKQLLKCVSLL